MQGETKRPTNGTLFDSELLETTESLVTEDCLLDLCDEEQQFGKDTHGFYEPNSRHLI